jgi:hypothetical protein
MEVAIESASVCVSYDMEFFEMRKKMFHSHTDSGYESVLLFLFLCKFSLVRLLGRHEDVVCLVVFLDTLKSKIQPEKVFHKYLQKSGLFEERVIMF